MSQFASNLIDPLSPIQTTTTTTTVNMPPPSSISPITSSRTSVTSSAVTSPTTTIPTPVTSGSLAHSSTPSLREKEIPPPIRLLLVPYNEVGTRTTNLSSPPSLFDAIERNLAQNVISKVGRLVRGQQEKAPIGSEHIWFKSKVISRHHAEIWAKDGQVRDKFFCKIYSFSFVFFFLP